MAYGSGGGDDVVKAFFNSYMAIGFWVIRLLKLSIDAH